MGLRSMMIVIRWALGWAKVFQMNGCWPWQTSARSMSRPVGTKEPTYRNNCEYHFPANSDDDVLWFLDSGVAVANDYLLLFL